MNAPAPKKRSSPGAAAKRARLAGAGAFLIFLLPVMLVVAAFGHIFEGRIVPFLVALGLFVAFGLAGALMRTGLTKEAEFRARRLGRAAIVPYKLFASIIVGAATFATAWLLTRNGFFLSVAYGGGALAGAMLLYGPDPWGAKGLKDTSGIDGAAVVQALEEARAKLARIETAAKSIQQPHFRQDLRDILGRAGDVLAEIERDPRDLRRARKFLNVYLSGAAEVTENFVETWPKTKTPELEENFRELLADMKRVFAEQHDKLLQDDELDLDVQMKVLRTRLEKEGVL